MIICKYAKKQKQEKDWRCVLSKEKCSYEYPIVEICKSVKTRKEKRKNE